MAQFGSNRSVIAQNQSAVTDPNGNLIVSPDNGWTGSPLGVAGRATSIQLGEGGTLFYICDVTDLDLAAMWPAAAPTVTLPPAAPIWPGMTNVTLGDPVSLSDGLTVAGPMDGLLITIDSHPSWAGKYAFGDVNSWVHCGSIIFGNDDGEYEYPQQIGLDSHLLTPKMMVSAASAIVRLNSGFGGTATPWTRNA